jgi:hypothetical protein
MEVIAKMRFADFEDLEQAEAHAGRGKGAAGEKEPRPCGSKGSEWMYTGPYREASKWKAPLEQEEGS